MYFIRICVDYNKSCADEQLKIITKNISKAINYITDLGTEKRSFFCNKHSNCRYHYGHYSNGVHGSVYGIIGGGTTKNKILSDKIFIKNYYMDTKIGRLIRDTIIDIIKVSKKEDALIYQSINIDGIIFSYMVQWCDDEVSIRTARKRYTEFLSDAISFMKSIKQCRTEEYKAGYYIMIN